MQEKNTNFRIKQKNENFFDKNLCLEKKLFNFALAIGRLAQLV